MKEFDLLPPDPKAGVWYEIRPEGAVSADGSPWHCCLRPGNSKNLLILLQGGGVSVSAETARHPRRGLPGENACYRANTVSVDKAVGRGLTAARRDNPFRDDWMLFLPCANGDFHAGSGDFPYTDADGQPAVLHHHGYTNTEAALRQLAELVPAPERICLCGASAGGFGAALMADTVARFFPDCRQFFCLIDCAFLPGSWPDIAQTVWQSPDCVRSKLHSRDLTADCLEALRAGHPYMRFAYTATPCDSVLSAYQNLMDRGELITDRESGLRYRSALSESLRRMRASVPDLSAFIYSMPGKRPDDAANGLTRHCIIFDPELYRLSCEGMRFLRFLRLFLAGECVCRGLTLLEDHENEN